MRNEAFYKELFTTLLANMPKDTRNMMTQSKLEIGRASCRERV